MIKYYKKKLSKNDFAKNKEYYRDILKQYSVDLLSYIDNVELKYPDVLVAMLLQLKLKGIISIENSNIYLNNTVDINSLSNNEKYLISKINNKLVISDTYEYEKLVVKEGLSKGLLEERKCTQEHLKKELIKEEILYALVFIGYVLFWKYCPDSIQLTENYISIFIMMLVVFIPIIFIIGHPIYIFLSMFLTT